MLLSYLPPDSSLGRAIHGDMSSWTVEHELLATLVDVANMHRWQHQLVNFKKPPRTPPDPFPRPDVAVPHRPAHVRSTRPRRHMTHDEMADTFGLPLRADRREGDADGD